MTTSKNFRLTPLALSLLLLSSSNVWADNLTISETWKMDGWSWNGSTQIFSNSNKNALIADGASLKGNSSTETVNFTSSPKINIETEGSFISNASLGSSGKQITYSVYNKIGTIKSGAIAFNLTKQGSQIVNLNDVEEVIANNSSTDPSAGARALSIIFTGGGNSSAPKAEQELGSFNLMTLRGTEAGKGFGIVLVDDATSSSNSCSQYLKTYITNVGTEEFPLDVGVLAQFKDPGINIFPKGDQTLRHVGTIYATEAGIVNLSGTGQSNQWVSSVTDIFVDSSKALTPVPILAGIAGEAKSRNGNSTDTSNIRVGQTVKVRNLISVEGSLAKSSEQPASNISYIKDESQINIRAGVLNRGGRQAIESISENVSGVTIRVGTKSPDESINYAVLVYPLFSQSVTTTSGQNGLSKGFSPTDTQLKGSFNVVNGDVAVFGPQARTAGEEHYLKVGNVSLTLNNTTRTTEDKQTVIVPSTLTLGGNSNLWVTNRSFDVYAGNGVARAGENTIFSLSAGSGADADNAYRINLTGGKNFIYVDGTYKGNSTINLESTWSSEGKIVAVNKNPIVIRNVGLQTDNSKSHLNLNVNLASSLPASERDKFFDADNANVQILMRQAVENLMIGEGAENLEVGGLIVAGDQVDVGTFSETEKNLALKDSTKGISSRVAKGYVSVTTPEGLITPQKTFVSQYYLDNTGATGKDATAVLTVLNEKVNTAAAAMHGKGLADTQSLSRAGDDEASIYAIGSGAIYSEKVLPEEASTEISNKPSQGEETGDDSGNENTEGTDSGNNNQGGNSTTTVEGKTSTMASLESVGMSNYFVWREDVETLSQRLGEVRMTPELEGMWVRVIGGKNKYDRSFDYFSNKFYGIQLGVDRNIGGDFGWTLGAAFSYIDGDAKLANGGKDDNYLGSFSLYATKQFENACYLDLIAKFSRMHNDFTAVSNDRVYFSKGKYSTNAFQLGVEYGKRFTFGQNWFVDPQVQLTYGHINKVSYKTDTGVNAKVKDINSLIGRVGVGGGYQNDKLSAFVKVDALRDFTAKYKADYQVENVRNHSTESLKDTWGEISAGTTVNFGKNVKGYAQIKRSFAAKVKQEYRADVGLRLVF